MGPLGIVLRFPVEYMANGMAFWVIRGLIVSAGAGGGTDVLIPIPRAPRIPPSLEKMWLMSNPGVFIGTPLKSRHEI
jgi:hypothetical protein